MAIRPARAPRSVALLAALALTALLIGLSAAHTALPGDTFQVAPRAAASAAVAVALPDDPDTVPPIGSLLAILPVAVAFAVGGLAVARARHTVAPLSTRALPAAGCRGPPASA
ncbi:hypothetical protein GCM10009682_60110 [Luedemannella flava]|uniref:Uncharacterized protein n=1 Tax=Luedemannella flava TaxID=349316 RepID=A0ABP4Z0I8_9ACTN